MQFYIMQKGRMKKLPFFHTPLLLSIIFFMMSGAKAPNYDTHRLPIFLRHFSTYFSYAQYADCLLYTSSDAATIENISPALKPQAGFIYLLHNIFNLPIHLTMISDCLVIMDNILYLLTIQGRHITCLLYTSPLILHQIHIIK